MSFTGDESAQITLDQATTWTKNFRAANPSSTKAYFFGINKIKTILSQSGCVGIRSYNAIDDTGKTQLVWVGVTADGKDMYNGIILDRSYPCPNYCDSTSPLCG